MKIGITGSQGLLGWHLSCYLRSRQIEIVRADRSTFATHEALLKFVESVDVIAHFAGMNRGDESEVARTNIELCQNLAEACYKSKKKIHLIFSSSNHIYRGTVYGRSKAECTEIFKNWSRDTESPFTNLVLPNIFGEGGKPFYNSAVSTFCHQLARQESPEIHKDAELEFIHAGQVAKLVWDVIQTGQTGELIPSGQKLRVSALLARLKEMDQSYRAGVLPRLGSDFELDLFNTYRHYLFPSFYPSLLKQHVDARGYLFEAFKGFGESQVFISSTEPGVTRGNHFHLRKIERFCVIQGSAKIELRKIFSDEVYEFVVKGESPCFLDIPTLYTHSIRNTGSEKLLTLFWANEIFNPNSPDTYAEGVRL